MIRPHHALVVDSWWALAKVLTCAALMVGVSFYAGYDSHRDSEHPAPTVETVYEQVTWVRDGDGVWQCEPWSTVAEALRKCLGADLPPDVRDRTPVEAREGSA